MPGFRLSSRRPTGLTAIALLVSGLLLCHPAGAQEHSDEFSTAEPEEVGLSSERLERVTRLARRNVEEDRLAGSVLLLAREGRVAYLEALGMQDREAGTPMTENTIFRIASMTKPITSAAVMMLYEEGHFRLSDPVSEYIPAFDSVRVLADSADAAAEDPATVPAERPITIRHLLTHTSGLVYEWHPELGETYAEAGIMSGLVEDENTLAEDIPKLAELPLLHQPGEAWTYGMSVDVLGRLVEVVSGRPLDEFFRERLFEPLGMDDTQFYVSPEQESRLAAAYTVGPDGGLKRIEGEQMERQGSAAYSYSASYPTREDHRFLSGGAGLTSTVPDYYRFARMLLNRGALNGERLLSPKSVELMTTDHVGSRLDDQGFGLGVGITRDLAERGELGSEGTFYWGSFWYGTFFIDPEEEMIGIMLAQKHPAGAATLSEKFDILARQAIVE